MAGNPYSLQPVIDYIEHPNPNDSQMGKKMASENPSVIIPFIMALYNRIGLYKEVIIFLDNVLCLFQAIGLVERIQYVLFAVKIRSWN